ncbi:MAG: eukaryotic-like serine/threonine-protein kinase [Candidatus Sumerlaeota bacterium]|nr:eukaryotic-like serine/threonine-protein kinase [Candidatus Sumerlaeota bacterium]
MREIGQTTDHALQPHSLTRLSQDSLTANVKLETAIKTLVFSDLIGSTRIVSEVGDDRAARIFRRHDKRIRALLAEYRGVEVERTDGFLAMFDRPIDAVRYALALHPELADISEGAGVVLAARVGIHLGEVVLVPVANGTKPLEAEGITRVVCARLMSLAQAGQTLISRGAFDLAKRASVGTDIAASGVRWQSHGNYVLKGVEFEGESDPIEVCEVGYMGTGPFVRPPDTEKASRVPEPSESAALKIPVPEIRGVPSHRLRPIVKIAITVLVILGLGSTALLLLMPDENAPAREDVVSGPITQPAASSAEVVAALDKADFPAAIAAMQGHPEWSEALAAAREAARLTLAPGTPEEIAASLEDGLSAAEPGEAWRRLLALKLMGSPNADAHLETFRQAHPDALDAIREDAWRAAGRLREAATPSK